MPITLVITTAPLKGFTKNITPIIKQIAEIIKDENQVLLPIFFNSKEYWILGILLEIK